MESKDTTKREMKFCPECNSIVETEILYHYHIEEHYNGDLQGGGELINLAKCLRCNRPFLTEIDYQYIEEHTWENYNIQLYPGTEN